jgi:transposase-like protein
VPGAFCDVFAEHLKHIRTTNPLKSTFATIRHRTGKTKGRLSRKAGLAMAVNDVSPNQMAQA